MDIFCEFIVKKKFGVMDFLKLIGLSSAAVILALVLLFVSSPFLGSGIGMLLAAGVIYLAYILSKGLFVEFEYALTNNELDVDKIFAKSKRKRVITIDFKNIEICANINDEKYSHEYKNTSSITKRLDLTGVCDYDIYFVDFAGENGKTRVLFQPTDKMKDAMKLINPRFIHIS